MSQRDVPTHEMGPHEPIDAGFERLLAGGPAERGTHLAQLVTALRSDVRVPTAEDAHVAAMIETARTSAPTASPLRLAPLPPRTSRSRVLLKVLAPAFAALLLFSGMAVAHVLPAPLQTAFDRWNGTASGAADLTPLDDLDTPISVDADPHSSAGGDAHRRDGGRRPEDRGNAAKNDGQPADHPGQGGAQGENNAVDPDDQGQDPSAADRGHGDEYRDDQAVDPGDQGQDLAAADRGHGDELQGGDRH